MSTEKYVPLASLFTYFVNKDSGLPLKYGRLEFYSDINRSQFKAIYEISGNPPNYTFNQLENPLYLSGVGTFIDENDALIIPYGYPYDSNGNTENYYIKIYDSSGVLQGDVENWPNFGINSGGSATDQPFNFIPNGQFWTHNDIPADELKNIPAGQIRNDITQIAAGNWTFERSTGSTSTDNISFFEYNQYVEIPTASPRFSCRVQCLGSDPSDTFKYLKISFDNVNQFSSDTQEYTFYFNAATFNSGNFSVGLNLIKNYGTGGAPSPTENTQLTTFQITSTATSFQFPFVFGANTGKQVGSDFGSDSVSLVLSFPTNFSFGGDFTDFGLFLGEIIIDKFPEITVKDTSVRTISPTIPDFDGNDLYLPCVTGPNGLIYDDSSIGTIESLFYDFGQSLHPTSNLMRLDGAQYLVDGYSPLGIPFRRIWSKVIFDETTLLPKFGTGNNFVTCFSEGAIGSSGSVFFFNNGNGALASQPTNGTISPGLTFFNISNGFSDADGSYYNSYIMGNLGMSTQNVVLLIAKNRGSLPAPTASDNTGFSVYVVKNQQFAGTTPGNIPEPFRVTVEYNLESVIPSSLSGKYFQYSAVNTSNTIVQQYIWFTVDGSGSDPVLSGMPVQVNLKSTFSQNDLANIICYAIQGCNGSYITFPAASTIPVSSYFEFKIFNGDNYSVYYTVDGVGTEPSITSVLNIKVDLLSTDTPAIVAKKTMTAINSTYFEIIDASGLFFRVNDFDQLVDFDSPRRFGKAGQAFALNTGSLEYDSIIAHTHGFYEYDPPSPATGFSFLSYKNQGPNFEDRTLGYTGIYETRPFNISVNAAIRY